MTLKKKVLSIAALALLSVSTLSAQSTDSGVQSVPLFGLPSLTITPDAMSAGLGDQGVVTPADAASIHYNMSKLAFTHTTAGVLLSYTPWMTSVSKDMGATYLSGYYSWGQISRHAVSGSVRYFNIGEVRPLLKGGGSNVQMIHPYEYALDLGYAYRMHSHLALGVALRYAVSDMNFSYQNHNHKGTSVMVDLSATYRDSLKIWGYRSHWSAAVAINNIGSKYAYGQSERKLFVPTTLRFGTGGEIEVDPTGILGLYLEVDKYLVPSSPVFTASDYKAEQDKYKSLSALSGMVQSWSGSFQNKMRDLSLALGADYTYDHLLVGRIGYRYEAASRGSRTGIYAGLGVRYRYYHLDTSYFLATGEDNPLNNTVRLTLGVVF